MIWGMSGIDEKTNDCAFGAGCSVAGPWRVPAKARKTLGGF
jgi:hypothetical protein